MNCQNCNQRTASVHFTQVVNNTKKEMYLCERCAAEKGKLNLNINDFFSSLIWFPEQNTQFDIDPVTAVCEKCGTSYEEFQRSGKFGCENCYDIFGERLKPLLKRIHGSAEHNGKVPNRMHSSIKSTKEIDLLKDKLAKAISVEEYELAAKIRDKIKSLEVEK